MSEKVTENQQKMAEMLDAALVDVLENGEEVVTPDGGTIRKRPSAAMLRCISDRVHKLRIQSPIAPGSAADQLLIRAESRLRLAGTGTDGLPPLDLENDDEATR